MYAIVKTGGKQYRVEQGQSLLVERLPVEGGGKATLQPLLYVDGENVVDGEDLAKVSIQARVVGHERGPKLRVVKFKPKRGYRRRTGHRQELTRIEVTEIKLSERRAPARRSQKPAAEEQSAAPKPVAAQPAVTPEAATPEAEPKSPRRRTSTKAKAAEGEAKPARPRRKQTTEPEAEEGNGA